jgi:signal transduction histidine kinase/CheY-like chemotaxis protein
MKLLLSRPTMMSYSLILSLLLLTPALLIWQHFGMTQVLEISPRQPHGVKVLDDRVYKEGDSVSSLVRTRDAFILRCRLGHGTDYPFCKLQFLMGDATKGVDLSGYDTIAFDMDYSGASPQLVKLHLLNFEPDLSTVGDWNSQRYNEVQIEMRPGMSRFTIPLNAVQTADWWRGQRNLPLSKGYTRLDNVTAVELATASISPGQMVTIELRSIRFIGKWMSETTLLMYLVSAWIGCAILGLAQALLHYRSSLSATTLRLEQMAAVDRERKAAEAAREAALAEAVGLARERSNFLAQMSHELRTPLNAIMGYAQLLQHDPHQSAERRAAGLATIQESSRHLLTLINDILDLARVEAGKLVLHPAPVHLGDFLRGVVDIVRVKAEEKSLLFRFELAENVPAAVTIDETRLRQVLLNLLGNAVKFTDRGTVVLRVLPAPPVDGAAEPGGEDRVTIRFEVADSGIGMSASQLGRLFQPFEQVANTARREGGAGLGLAISQQLVRLMGGNIAVTSEPDKGSVFWFDLAVPVAASTPAVAPVPRTVSGYEGKRRRLLIVDDVPQNRAVLLDTLGPLGFIVTSAGNGLECLALLDSFKPDLIVMDVMMPELDGNETTRRIRQLPEWSKIPIIAVTASASHEDELKCREAGVDAFLAKPIDHDALLDAIGRQLNLSWNTGQPPASEPPAAPDEKVGGLVIPSAEEIEALWILARTGDMRRIREQADYLEAHDPACAAFAQRVQVLAQGYHSKALLDFVERYRPTMQ